MKVTKVSKELEAHPLWEGSMEQQSLQYNCLTVNHLRDRIETLERCKKDKSAPLTPREASLLELLKKEVKKLDP